MIDVQIQSVSKPISDSPELTTLALRLLSRAQVMGFLPRDVDVPLTLDTDLLVRIGEAIGSAGVATHAVPLLRLRGARLEQALRTTLEAVDASPRPSGEWEPARGILGDELLASLLGISESSLRRYAAGTRTTPDETAWRLHAVARMLAALVGSYNDYGIRRWFERPRSALAAKTPADVLRGAAREDDVVPAVELAAGLEG